MFRNHGIVLLIKMAEYNWESFSGELAQKILSYSSNRQALLNVVREIYKTYSDRNYYDVLDRSDSDIYPFCGWTSYEDHHKRPDDPTRVGDILLNDERITEIDPLTIFRYFFNGHIIGRKDSFDLAHEFFELKEENKFPFDQYHGYGIPSIARSPLTVVYYSASNDYFGHSESYSVSTYEEAMDLAWSFFKDAVSCDLSSAETDDSCKNFVSEFEKIYGLYYMSVKTTTITLFYIAPTKFISLDSNTVAYIESNKNIFPKSYEILSKYTLEKKVSSNNTKRPLPGREYVNLCSTLKEEIEQAHIDGVDDFLDLVHAAFMKNQVEQQNASFEEIEDDEMDNEPEFLGNVIYYGIPGSGKSYKIKTEIIDKLANEPGGGSDRYERILFHPDYTYSDFVGQILPQKYGKNGVTYDFVLGPFSRILQNALDHHEKNYYLIIDEINRGNAPAIFGDIFQLLDRIEDGKPNAGESQYHINNKDIQDNIGASEIYLPSNLSIVATMNTSDQNVFTLDTAFKRRWRMEYIKDDIDEAIEYKDLEIGNTGVTWKRFHDAVNDTIKNGSSHIVSAEDKRLGAYFCSKDEITDITLFTNKVLRYLWDDVARLNKDIFKEGDTVKTFEDIYDAREKDNFFEYIFKNDLYQKLR